MGLTEEQSIRISILNLAIAFLQNIVCCLISWFAVQISPCCLWWARYYSRGKLMCFLCQSTSLIALSFAASASHKTLELGGSVQILLPFFLPCVWFRANLSVFCQLHKQMQGVWVFWPLFLSSWVSPLPLLCFILRVSVCFWFHLFLTLGNRNSDVFIWVSSKALHG